MEFYGEPQRFSMRANVAVMDGEIVGIIGISRQPEIGLFFSEFRPALQPYLKSITIMRAIKDALTMVREYRGPVLTIADDAESCRLLHRLGFTHLYGAWHGWLHYPG